MESFDSLILGYTLKKLTGVLEKVMGISKIPSTDKSMGGLDVGQTKTAKKIHIWLGRLKFNTPYKVTHVLIDQMHVSRKFNRDQRFAAQVVLLEALVEGGLAMQIESYSVVVVENRLKCFLDQ